MLFNLSILLFSFVISFFTLLLLINNFFDKLLIQKKIKDLARIRWGESDKSHYGGFSFAISIIILNFILVIFYKNFFLENFNNIFFFSLIIVLAGFFGLIDEKYSCKPVEKLVLQFIIASLLVLDGKLINFSSSDTFNIFFTIFYYIFIFNVINMFDNIDLGLASISIPIVIILLAMQNTDTNTVILFIFLGSLIAFSFFNYHPSKIFMGDIGSFQIATILSAISCDIFWSEYRFDGYFNSIYNLGLQNLIFIIPLSDFIIVSYRRFYLGKSLIVGDTNHISHIFNFKINNPNIIALIFFILTSVSGLFYFIHKIYFVPSKYSLLLILIFYIVSLLLLFYFYYPITQKKND